MCCRYIWSKCVSKTRSWLSQSASPRGNRKRSFRPRRNPQDHPPRFHQRHSWIHEAKRRDPPLSESPGAAPLVFKGAGFDSNQRQARLHETQQHSRRSAKSLMLMLGPRGQTPGPDQTEANHSQNGSVDQEFVLHYASSNGFVLSQTTQRDHAPRSFDGHPA